MVARGGLLEKYGYPHVWIRFDHPIRIVDARPRRNSPNYLGWVHIDGRFTDTVRWINESNFNKYYRKVQ
jgi:hypothetical protein